MFRSTACRYPALEVLAPASDEVDAPRRRGVWNPRKHDTRAISHNEEARALKAILDAHVDDEDAEDVFGLNTP